MKRYDADTAVREYSPHGLDSNQVKIKRANCGENRFDSRKTNPVKLFFGQFANPISFLLIAACMLSVFMGEFSDAAVIGVIVGLNSVLGFIQEYRSEKAVERLSEFIEQTCTVVRNNEKVVLPAHELVPGDTVILRGGDIVPADLKIMSSYGLSVNESHLTGESVSVFKSEHPNESEQDILYTGSTVEKGYCTCVVFATGRTSVLGRIADLSKDTKKVTPHQKSLAEFSAWLLRIIGATVVLLLVVKAFTIGSMNDFAEVVLFAVALAMTSVPEALPMITTINLSYGALRLAKQNVVVKRLSAIENLGRINLLCTDKTGTLTEDRLTVETIESDDPELFDRLSYASMEDYDLQNKKHAGSFDNAFVRHVSAAAKKDALAWDRVLSVPFDPALRRRRVVLRNSVEDSHYLVTIGAPETLLELSENENAEHYSALVSESGNSGMRQLAIAYKKIDYTPDSRIEDLEHSLTFLGFANFIDPLRQTAAASIARARSIGVGVKIISGDSPEVVGYTGRELGLTKPGEKIYTGDQLMSLGAEDFTRTITECSVFARVNPQQKHAIIEHLRRDFVVGYQGDGINDAPALGAADVAVAVHTATDVAKDSADIVLLEDNLEVIVNGIEYGRSIFVNINKYIKHAMIGNLGNFFSMIVFYLMFAADIPMLAIQLLIGNIIQDMPLMTVFSDSVDPEEVREPQSESGISGIISTSYRLGIFTAVYYLLFFLYIGTEASPLTQTILFLFYNFTQLLVIVSVRSKRRFFWQGAKPSRMLLGTIVLFMAVSLALVYIPFTADMMGFVPLGALPLAVVTGASAAYIFLLDFAKIAFSKLRTSKPAKLSPGR